MKPATAMACWRRADIMPLLKALLNTPFGNAPLPRYFRFQAALMLKGSLKPFLARGKILPCSRYAANLSDKPPARAKSSVTIFTFKGSLKMNKPIFRLPLVCAACR
ncbi:hypothetical protein [Kingella oralis]|uniref:hypothetical protein n=1 Tax=Kingella oralis TaxID=505 RepID=UPI0034E4FB47